MTNSIVFYPEHLPAIQANHLLSLKAIYSRSKASADKLAKSAARPIRTYYDSPNISNFSLDDLLACEDIDAVIIALPICVQPIVIKKAIEAGKHVLSEKPIGKDIETAARLTKWFKHVKREEMWSVGENFRFFEPITFAAEQIEKLGGELVTFSVDLYAFIDESDEYFRTTWYVFLCFRRGTLSLRHAKRRSLTRRQKPDYQGGFILDGGIHYVAALRCLLAAAGQMISTVRASTSLVKEDLAPVDTLHASMTTASNRHGTFNLSYGSKFRRECRIRIVMTSGALTVTPSEVTISRNDKRAIHEKSFRFPPSSGVRKEVAAFAESIRTKEPDPRGSPEQAYNDLKLLQSMLESGDEEGAAKRV